MRIRVASLEVVLAPAFHGLDPNVASVAPNAHVVLVVFEYCSFAARPGRPESPEVARMSPGVTTPAGLPLER